MTSNNQGIIVCNNKSLNSFPGSESSLSFELFPVGAEVSAKFKGAFCEAKILSIDTCLYVHVSLMDSGKGLITPNRKTSKILWSELLKNSEIKEIKPRVGESVVFSHPETGILVSGVISKIVDKSKYTVQFDDDEISVVTSAGLRPKGDRAFLNMSTLVNMPFTDPKKFVAPVVTPNSYKKSNSLKLENEADSDLNRSATQSSLYKSSDSIFEFLDEADQHWGSKRECVFVDPLDATAEFWPVALIVPEYEVDGTVMNGLIPSLSQCVVLYLDTGKFALVSKFRLRIFSRSVPLYKLFQRNVPHFKNNKGVLVALSYIETGLVPTDYAWPLFLREMEEKEKRPSFLPNISLNELSPRESVVGSMLSTHSSHTNASNKRGKKLFAESFEPPNQGFIDSFNSLEVDLPILDASIGTGIEQEVKNNKYNTKVTSLIGTKHSLLEKPRQKELEVGNCKSVVCDSNIVSGQCDMDTSLLDEILIIDNEAEVTKTFASVEANSDICANVNYNSDGDVSNINCSNSSDSNCDNNNSDNINYTNNYSNIENNEESCNYSNVINCCSTSYESLNDIIIEKSSYELDDSASSKEDNLIFGVKDSSFDSFIIDAPDIDDNKFCNLPGDDNNFANTDDKSSIHGNNTFEDTSVSDFSCKASNISVKDALRNSMKYNSKKYMKKTTKSKIQNLGLQINLKTNLVARKVSEHLKVDYKKIRKQYELKVQSMTIDMVKTRMEELKEEYKKKRKELELLNNGKRTQEEKKRL